LESKNLTINFLSPVQDLIPLVEARMRAQANGHNPALGFALDHLLSSGGKRVRPAVVLLVGGMLGASPDRLVTLSAAIELLHTATLVHDDLIDGALLRRGISTLNVHWSPAATVLTGDFIFARAAKLAAETDSVSVMHLFAETLANIVNGELTQMFTGKFTADQENYLQRIYAKTASMFELAAAAAALLSPVGEKEVETARSFGYHIGMAFQIVDDILDFTGEQETVGKPVGSDLRQGLLTLPALYYLRDHPGDEDIRCLLDGKGYDDALFDRLVASIRTSGTIQRSLEEARRYIDEALRDLFLFPDCTERRALEALAFYIVDREL
jgi:geranylgeranyl pyrophosphate synthase